MREFEDQIIHTKYKNGLSDDVRDALKRYVNSSTYLNNLLRDAFDINNKEHVREYSKDKNDIIKRIINMDAALESAELKRINLKLKPFVVYRGINASVLGALLKHQGYIPHPHYMSTSVHKAVANKAFAGDSCCTFEIIVDPKKCSRFLYISGKKSNDGIKGTSEDEILFGRNTFLLFKSEVEENGRKYFLVEVSDINPGKGACPRITSRTSPKTSPGSKSKSPKTSPKSKKVVITEDMVQEELDFIDDSLSSDEIVDSISDSLQKTLYKTTPIETIKAQVRKILIKLRSV